MMHHRIGHQISIAATSCADTDRVYTIMRNSRVHRNDDGDDDEGDRQSPSVVGAAFWDWRHLDKCLTPKCLGKRSIYLHKIKKGLAYTTDFLTFPMRSSPCYNNLLRRQHV